MKTRLEATHFIEQYNTSDNRCLQGSVPISLLFLDDQLETTKSCYPVLTTVAIFKIKYK